MADNKKPYQEPSASHDQPNVGDTRLSADLPGFVSAAEPAARANAASEKPEGTTDAVGKETNDKPPGPLKAEAEINADAIAALSAAATDVLARQKKAPMSMSEQDMAHLGAVLQGTRPAVSIDASVGAAGNVATPQVTRPVTAAEDLLNIDQALMGGGVDLSTVTLSATGHVSPATARSLTGVLKGEGIDPTVLPVASCSSYRITQAEGALNRYEELTDQFWRSASLEGIKAQIEAEARHKGITTDKVIEQMKPGGEFAALGKQFREAVKNDPDEALPKFRALGKPLNSFLNQFRAGSMELQGTPDGKTKREWDTRLNASLDKMLTLTSTMPQFPEEERSHRGKLDATMNDVSEKMKQITPSALFLNEKPEPVEDNDPRP